MRSRGRRWLLVSGGMVVLGLLFALSQPHRWDDWRASLFGPSAQRFPVRGIDVSHHQGRIDWARVRASGQAFVFIKATEGADFRDRRFADNWRDARAAGLVAGAYHFFTFCAPGLLQAENFLAVAPRDAGALPLAVDVEFTGNCVGWESLEEIRRELVAFVRHVEAHFGRALLLYTTEDVRRELVPRELHDRRYWLRSLWGKPSEDISWDFWQYSDTGTVPGIRGAVDLDVFAGSVQAWQAFVGGASAQRPR